MADARVPAGQSCGNCTAFIPFPGGGKGTCQAHPPLPLFGTHVRQPGAGIAKLEFYFPETSASDWCREYHKVTAQ